VNGKKRKIADSKNRLSVSDESTNQRIDELTIQQKTKSVKTMATYPQGGYIQKILRVDLTTGETRVESPDPALLKEYIGGTGLAMRLLYDEVQPGIDPYAPENRLIFMTGPLTGTLVPGSGTYAVVSRNTLTGLVGSAQANGFFGGRLKYAGFDGVIIQGRAEKPVYLHIHDGKAVLEDASFLAGKDTFETDTILRKRYGEGGFEHRLSVAAIGPAGEHLVRYACIVSDRGHVASSGGAGAIMGSKNLKALVVEGHGAVPIERNRVEDFRTLIRQWREEARNTGVGKTVSTAGTIGLFIPYHSRGWVPVKNLTTNIFEGEERFEAHYVREDLCASQPRSCHGCTFHHCHVVKIKHGPYKGFIGEEPEYEIFAGLGPNWGIYDPGAVVTLNNLVDRLGIDAKETSFTVSMVMEGFARGSLRPEDVDGLDLSWGKVDSVSQLLERISTRQGFGAVLAEGVMRAAHQLGAPFDEMAVYLKRGNAPHIHDPRTRWCTLFNQVVSNMGSQEGIDMTLRASPELGVERAASDPDEYLAEVEVKTAPKRQFEECLTFCYFQSAALPTMVSTLNCITGAEYSVEDCLTVGRRVINLMRMMNKREGMTRDDDSFSKRLGQPPVDGPGRGKSLAPTFDKILNAYYRQMGWNKDGMPSKKTLKSLNLDFTISS
jgi:aldehyde:ferredoxin oxidoreductase